MPRLLKTFTESQADAAIEYSRGANDALTHTQTSGDDPSVAIVEYRVDSNGNPKWDVYLLNGTWESGDGISAGADFERDLGIIRNNAEDNPSKAYVRPSNHIPQKESTT